MLGSLKVFSLFALASYASALKLVSVTGDAVVNGNVTVTWTTGPSDPPSVSIELVHPSDLNNAIAIGNAIPTSQLSVNVPLGTVAAADGYYIILVDISSIDTIYAASKPFSIAAADSVASISVKATSLTTTVFPSTTPDPVLSTPTATSTPTGFSTSVTTSTDAASTATSAAATPSASGNSAALSLRSGVSGSLLGALAIMVGAIVI